VFSLGSLMERRVSLGLQQLPDENGGLVRWNSPGLTFVPWSQIEGHIQAFTQTPAM